MKKYVTVALFIFWVVVTGLIVAGLLFQQNNKNPESNGINNQTGSSTALSATELAKHGTANNCWLLISGKIYDVGNYLSAHPGGAETMIPYCGSDATEAFATRGGGRRDHSSYAYQLLNDYYVGNLGQTVSQIKTQPAPTSSPASSDTGNQREEDDEDDD